MDVLSTMSATIRSATPSTPDSDSQFIRLNGAVSYGLLHVPRAVPIGVGAQVLDATLYLYKAEAWPSGSHTVTVEAIDETWDASVVTWSTAPPVIGSAAASVAGGGAAGDLIEIDITSLLQNSVSQEDATDSRWYGVRIKVSTTGEKKIFSAVAEATYQPRAEIEWSVAPNAPEDLSPSGGKAVSKVRPELVARFTDNDLDDTLASVQVQVATDISFATTVYDSGKVTHTQARFDMAAPPAGSASVSALTAGTTYYWRMKVWDNHNLESQWSDIASFTVTVKGSISLTSPSSTTVSTPIPTLSWTNTSFTQASVEIEILELQDGVWYTHYRVPRFVSTQTSIIVPDEYRLVEGVDYRAVVRAWDNVNRADMYGDRSFYEDSQDFTLTGLV